MSSYQGWSNYDTYIIGLWIDNDESLLNEFNDLGYQMRNSKICELGDAIKDFINNMRPDLGTTFWNDLLTSVINNVNWLELAENYKYDEEKME